MVVEILLGIYLGVIIFLGWQGFNILPLMILGLLVGAGIFLAQRKGIITLDLGQKKKSPKKAITFEHIGGQDGAINELKEALDFLENLDIVNQLGIRPLKGILLTGPPGTGKTLLAKGAAAYTGSAFMAVSGSDFVEMYAGVGAQRVRQLFKKARNTAAAKNLP